MFTVFVFLPDCIAVLDLDVEAVECALLRGGIEVEWVETDDGSVVAQAYRAPDREDEE